MALAGTIIGFLIGLIIAIIRTIPTTKNTNIVLKIFLKVINFILNAYVEIIRGTPMLVQAIILYYSIFVPMGIHDIGAKVLGEGIVSAIIIISFNTGAYMAEIVRGGIMSIDKGQFEGAHSIGMNHFQTMLYIILPQATRNIMPQIGNNLIINIKDTCVLSVIGTVELFFATKSVAGTYYTFFEAYTITMVMYLCMTVFFSKLLRIVENKLNGPEDYSLSTTDTLAYTSGLLKYPSKKEVE